jgi:hypothetical protein
MSLLSQLRQGRVVLLVAATIALVASSAVPATAAPGSAPASAPSSAQRTGNKPAPAPDFGPNVTVFDPSMPTSEIQATVDAIAAKQISNQFGTERYSLLFKPGTYGTVEAPLAFQVGYYTEVAGLGGSPGDVTINGRIDVYNQCETADNCIALNNFWRTMSNLTINVTGGEGCRADTEFWAVSQASPLRRVNVTGGTLTLMDYCTGGPQYASGGFMADSKAGTIVNGSQQQFLVRDSAIGSWSNAVWNQVFAGVQGAPAQSFPNPQYTTLNANPISKEKPFITVNAAGSYSVFVPSLRTNSSGTTWESGPTAGSSIPLSKFYLAKPGDSVATINLQLLRGKNLIFTPGVYNIDRSILVLRPGTIILGLGVATLTAVNGAVPIRVADVPGVDIAGIMIDAGTSNSPALMQLGAPAVGKIWSWIHKHGSSASNPTVLQDVFFRIGGPHVGKATVSLEVNSNNVILDNIWAWRADHGSGVGWDVNTADTGVIVNGDNVTATGLFSEHYQKYNTVWNGENGKTIFYQNELPYDAPNQAAWQHDGSLGWAGYKVADTVKTHELWGGGSYIYTNVDPTIHASRGFEVPVKPGVKLHDILTVNLGAGTIDHIVNDTGDPVSNAATGIPSYLVEFPVP